MASKKGKKDQKAKKEKAPKAKKASKGKEEKAAKGKKQKAIKAGTKIERPDEGKKEMASKPAKTETFNAATKAVKNELFTAAAANDLAGVQKTVMEFPDSPSWQNKDGMTALMLAAQEGAREAAWVLARADNADVNARNENGSTALMYAAFNGKASVAEVLLGAGAKINQSNNNGHTALMSAAAHGYRNTLILLLEKGADPTVKDKEGTSVLDYARDNEFPEIVKLLEKAIENWVPPSPKDSFDEAAAQGKFYKTSSALRDLEKKIRDAGLNG